MACRFARKIGLRFSVEAAVSAATKHSAGDTPATTVTDE